jgi:hypothetical protein
MTDQPTTPQDRGDDVEGHGVLRPPLIEAPADDVEGHMARRFREEPPAERPTAVEPQAEDVEGHGMRVKYGPTEGRR